MNQMLVNLIFLQKSIASPGRGILAIDESNATCGKRLASIGLENTETNRQAYRQLLLTTPSLGEYISGAILFEETLYQSTTDGKKFVDCLREEKIMPGIKVDKVIVTRMTCGHTTIELPVIRAGEYILINPFGVTFF